MILLVATREARGSSGWQPKISTLTPLVTHFIWKESIPPEATATNKNLRGNYMVYFYTPTYKTFNSISSLQCHDYPQVSNIRRTLVGNWIVDHSDVVGASPVGHAPTTTSLTQHLASMDLAKTTARRERRIIEILGFGADYIRDFTVCDFNSIRVIQVMTLLTWRCLLSC